MGFLLNLLTLPVLGPIKGVYWMAAKTLERAEGEMMDEDRVRAQLWDLQTRYDLGEIDGESYDKEEIALLERLKEIRRAKAQQG